MKFDSPHPYLIVALGPDAIEAGKKNACNMPATDKTEPAAEARCNGKNSS